MCIKASLTMAGPGAASRMIGLNRLDAARLVKRTRAAFRGTSAFPMDLAG
jgi:hypothetical protein